jgi:hypothetical protein
LFLVICGWSYASCFVRTGLRKGAELQGLHSAGGRKGDAGVEARGWRGGGCRAKPGGGGVAGATGVGACQAAKSYNR